MNRKINILFLVAAMSILFLPGVLGDLTEYSDYYLDPKTPEISVSRGDTVDGEFELINIGNETLHGTVKVNQFKCANKCPRTEIISTSSISVQPNSSVTIKFRVTSKWTNEVQKIIQPFEVVIDDDEYFTMDLIINVEHNFLSYSICIGISVVFFTGLIAVIVKIRKIINDRK